MSSNSSVSNNTTLHPNLFSVLADCFFNKPSSTIYMSYSITNILFVLLFSFLVLYLGLQKWRQHSTSTMVNHSDSFTYHMVITGLIGVVGFCLSYSGIDSKHYLMFRRGYYITAFSWYGETFFHMLTCTERYLAVVHPIIYRNLRSERGITVRNVCIGCVWLFSTLATIAMISDNAAIIVGVCVSFSALIFISFCSFSVLFVLIHPGPGERGRVDQSKRRAFYTIGVILGVLLLRITSNIVWFCAWTVGKTACVVSMSGVWFNLPCSLALPLLFVYKEGKSYLKKASKTSDKS